MRGRLFFIATSAFAGGVLYGTFASISLEYLALMVFLGGLCIGVHFLGFERSAQVFFLGIGLSLACFPIGEMRAQLAPHALPSGYSSLINKPISLTGKIIADPDIRQKNQQLIVAVDRKNQPTNVLVFAPLFQHFVYGEKILIAGTLMKPTPFSTDGGRVFRYDNFLAKKGVFSLVPQADILEVAPPSDLIDSIASMLFEIKHTFVEGLSRALPDPYAELATGLLTGDQHSLGDALITTLALSGLIWVVVLSGYHVTLIAEAVLTSVSFLPKQLAFLLATLSVMAIVFSTGASAPSLRGGSMACFTLFARSTSRTYDALRALCATTVLILIWNPLLLAYDSGFQLSLIVTPGLILGTPILEARLLWIRSALLREIVAVSSIAQFACLPLILWQTGQLGVWAIPANLLVMSFVPISMLFSVIAGIVGIILPSLAPLAGLPAYAVLYYVLAIAKISASLPFSDTVLPAFPFLIVVVMYAVLILIGYSLRGSSFKETQLLPIRPRLRSASQ